MNLTSTTHSPFTKFNIQTKHFSSGQIKNCFEVKLLPRKLQQQLHNPIIRKHQRMKKGESSIYLEYHSKKENGFKGKKLSVSKCKSEKSLDKQYILREQNSLKQFSLKQKVVRSNFAKPKFIYNLDLFQKKSNVDFRDWDVQNGIRNYHLSECVIKKDTNQQQKLNGFDIQNVPASVQPKVLSQKL